MTRKDYEAIAGALAGVVAMGDDIDSVYVALVDVLRADNPRFDAERFYQAVYGR